MVHFDSRRWPVSATAWALGLALTIAPAARANPSEPLVITELGKRAVGTDIPAERLRAAVEKGAAPERIFSFSRPLPISGGAQVVAWSECDRKLCRGLVGVLSGDGADPAKRLTVAQKQQLPAPPKVFMVDGVQIQAVALLDVDGDGHPELLIDYSVAEPPRPALGSLAHQYYAIYNLPALTAAWNFEVHRSGGAVEPSCDWDITRSPLGPPAASAPPALTATGGCKPNSAAAAPLPTSKHFVWNRASKRFLPSGN